jgi:hypothetical protein
MLKLTSYYKLLNSVQRELILNKVNVLVPTFKLRATLYLHNNGNKSNINFRYFSNTCSLQFISKNNLKSDYNSKKNQQIKFLLLSFVTGIGVFSLASYFSNLSKKKQNIESNKNETNDLDLNLKLDLNEIYERCAILFLYNTQVNYFEFSFFFFLIGTLKF